MKSHATTTIRLDKYLAQMGLAARRDIERVLVKHTVTVNGHVMTEPGHRINPISDTILVNGKTIKEPQLVYYLLHKPKGVISTASDERGRKTVTSLIPTKERIFPVGRLDKDSTGLVLLTNDGELANKLIHPRYHIPKTYEVVLKGSVPQGKLQKLREGVRLEEGKTLPAEIRIVKQSEDKTTIEIILYEGRKRQIRRMCEALHLFLLELKRTRIGSVTLQGLAPGKYRLLKKEELRALYNDATANHI